jgi:hypothetical protein
MSVMHCMLLQGEHHTALISNGHADSKYIMMYCYKAFLITAWQYHQQELRIIKIRLIYEVIPQAEIRITYRGRLHCELPKNLINVKQFIKL